MGLAPENECTLIDELCQIRELLQNIAKELKRIADELANKNKRKRGF